MSRLGAGGLAACTTSTCRSALNLSQYRNAPVLRADATRLLPGALFVTMRVAVQTATSPAGRRGGLSSGAACHARQRGRSPLEAPPRGMQWPGSSFSARAGPCVNRVNHPLALQTTLLGVKCHTCRFIQVALLYSCPTRSSTYYDYSSIYYGNAIHTYYLPRG